MQPHFSSKMYTQLDKVKLQTTLVSNLPKDPEGMNSHKAIKFKI